MMINNAHSSAAMCQQVVVYRRRPYFLSPLRLGCWCLMKTDPFILLCKNNRHFYVRSQGKQLVLFSQESWCFLRRSWGKHQDSRENKTNWFPEGPDVKCFVIFLDFHVNSNKRLTWANQNSRLCSYKNTNLILKTTEWMIYKYFLYYYLHLFPPQATLSLLGWL